MVALRGRGDAGAAALGIDIGLVAALAIVPLLLAFIAVELRQDRPAIDPRLLVHPPFAAAVAGVFGATVILHGTFILVPLAVEQVLGGTAALSGIALLG